MKHSKKYLAFALFGACCLSNSGSAYVYSFTNTTTSPISVDLCGVARVGCSMMQGNNEKPNESNFGATKRVSNAGGLVGPQTIEPKHTLELNFNKGDIGFCANLSQIKVGLNDQGISPRNVIIVENKTYDQLLTAIDSFGGDVSEIGESLSDVPNQVGAVAKVGSGLGKIVGSVARLARSSSCKDIHFVVINNKAKPDEIYVATRDL